MKDKRKGKRARTDCASDSNQTKRDRSHWLKELEELRKAYSTGKTGLTVEQILEEDRRERI
jgi:transcriptional regulator of NAD metabolism